MDAITNVTNESLDDNNIISERILTKAGDQLKDDLVHNIRRKNYLFNLKKNLP